MDIQSLNDSDLAAMLRERGVDVGPILDSTRRVYQRKLQRMIDEDNGVEGPYNQQDEEPAEEEEDDYDYANADTQPVEYIPVSEPVYQRETRHSPRRPQTRKETYDGGDSVTRSSHLTDDVLTRRTLRTTESSSSTTTSSSYQSKVKQQSEKPKKKGLSIWLQLLIFIVVAVLIFLIIQNMEPAAQDPVKGMPDV